MATILDDPALSAYESIAPFYDRYTAEYDYEHWLANLESIARDLGLRGRDVLDVGCGTGRSFVPLLERGYLVTACDQSPAMVDRARVAAAGRADVFVADMRELPDLGAFDLLTCLDDALNYLLTEDELAAAFDGFARNLRPGGLAAFDLNTLATYRGFFARDAASEDETTFFCWRGEGDPDAEPGAIATSVVEVFATDDGETWRRSSSRHLQRHHPPELVAELLADAGLELAWLGGQVTGAQIDPDPDEERHVKLVYFARRPPEAEEVNPE
jgi:SAM-dependent methyltransferase